MEQKKASRVKGFSNNGAVWEGQKDFDQDYISIEIVDYAEKTGQGENDFVIKKKVVETRTPIKEVVEADADSVGVYNIIKQVMRTGDTSLLPVDKGDCNVDMVGAPETLMEVKALGQNAEKIFDQLPKELTKGLDMKAFVDNLTQEQFDAFIKAISDRSTGKVEEIKDE